MNSFSALIVDILYIQWNPLCKVSWFKIYAHLSFSFTDHKFISVNFFLFPIKRFLQLSPLCHREILYKSSVYRLILNHNSQAPISSTVGFPHLYFFTLWTICFSHTHIFKPPHRKIQDIGFCMTGRR